MSSNEIITRFQISQYHGDLTIENVTAKQSPNGFNIEVRGTDLRGNIGSILSYVYDGHTDFKEGFSIVRKGIRYGIVDLTLKEVVSPVYQKISEVREGFAVAKRNSKAYYIDLTGYACEEIQEMFDEAHSVVNGMGLVKRDGKYGFYSKENYDIVVPCEYDYAYEFTLYRDYTAVKKDGLYGLVNKQGEMILEPVFDTIIFDSMGDSFKGCIGGKNYIGGPDGAYRVMDD